MHHLYWYWLPYLLWLFWKTFYRYKIIPKVNSHLWFWLSKERYPRIIYFPSSLYTYIYIYYRIYHIWNKYINETCKSILSKIAYDMDSITISACIFMNQYDIGNLGRKPLGWDPMNDGRPHMHVFITMCTTFEVPAEPCIYHAFFTMLLVLDSIIPR